MREDFPGSSSWEYNGMVVPISPSPHSYVFTLHRFSQLRLSRRYVDRDGSNANTLLLNCAMSTVQSPTLAPTSIALDVVVWNCRAHSIRGVSNGMGVLRVIGEHCLVVIRLVPAWLN